MKSFIFKQLENMKNHTLKIEDLVGTVSRSLASSTANGGKSFGIETPISNLSIKSSYYVVSGDGYGRRCVVEYIGESLETALEIYNKL